MKHEIQPWVAPVASRRWFGEGQHCIDSKPGDIILVEHGTSVGKFISFGQGVAALTETDLRNYTWNDHVAVIRDGGVDAIVSEMGPRGHEYRPLRDYQSVLYCVVSFNVDDATKQAVLVADKACESIDYGFVQYPALTLNALTGASIGLTIGSPMICSTEVAMIGMNRYWFLDREPASIMPAHISQAVGATKETARAI